MVCDAFLNIAGKPLFGNASPSGSTPLPAASRPACARCARHHPEDGGGGRVRDYLAAGVQVGVKRDLGLADLIQSPKHSLKSLEYASATTLKRDKAIF